MLDSLLPPAVSRFAKGKRNRTERAWPTKRFDLHTRNCRMRMVMVPCAVVKSGSGKTEAAFL